MRQRKTLHVRQITPQRLAAFWGVHGIFIEDVCCVRCNAKGEIHQDAPAYNLQEIIDKAKSGIPVKVINKKNEPSKTTILVSDDRRRTIHRS